MRMQPCEARGADRVVLRRAVDADGAVDAHPAGLQRVVGVAARCRTGRPPRPPTGELGAVQVGLTCLVWIANRPVRRRVGGLADGDAVGAVVAQALEQAQREGRLVDGDDRRVAVLEVLGADVGLGADELGRAGSRGLRRVAQRALDQRVDALDREARGPACALVRPMCVSADAHVGVPRRDVAPAWRSRRRTSRIGVRMNSTTGVTAASGAARRATAAAVASTSNSCLTRRGRAASALAAPWRTIDRARARAARTVVRSAARIWASVWPPTSTPATVTPGCDGRLGRRGRRRSARATGVGVGTGGGLRGGGRRRARGRRAARARRIASQVRPRAPAGECKQQLGDPLGLLELRAVAAALEQDDLGVGQRRAAAPSRPEWLTMRSRVPQISSTGHSTASRSKQSGRARAAAAGRSRAAAGPRAVGVVRRPSRG